MTATGSMSQLQHICGRYGVYVSSVGCMGPLWGIRVNYRIYVVVTGSTCQVLDVCGRYGVYESITGSAVAYWFVLSPRNQRVDGSIPAQCVYL